MQKRAYEDALGYSTQIDDTNQSPNFQQAGGNPTYQPTNYQNPGAV